MSPLRFRLSRRLGPVRLNLSKRGVSPSLTAGRVTTSRRGTSLRLLPGLSWWFGRGR